MPALQAPGESTHSVWRCQGAPMMPEGPLRAQPVTYSPGSGAFPPSHTTLPPLQQPTALSACALPLLGRQASWGGLGTESAASLAGVHCQRCWWQHMLRPALPTAQPAMAAPACSAQAGRAGQQLQSCEGAHVLVTVPEAASKGAPGMASER